ncbi:DNA polymerase ligase N-terminal domain-containing protein [Achromobacter animicus]|uniref:DNA polymerase ligase N-terminal domain-containing protein n=1 Tax=Achromobacter animicus TaxID=1389935 RepID=UPI0028AA3013|nr:DNA polymerase ligase N-terminal domain-containing protein [Achromobacter animicus]
MVSNGGRFVIYRSLIRPEQFELVLARGGLARRWKVLNGVPTDTKTRHIAVEQPTVCAPYRRFSKRAAVFSRSPAPAYTWDAGIWYSVGDSEGYRSGHLRFCLRGLLLRGRWALVRMSGEGAGRHPPWLFVLTAPPDGHE